MWVPALGLALFVLVALYLVIGAAFEDVDAEQAVDEAPAAEAAPAAAEGAAAIVEGNAQRGRCCSHHKRRRDLASRNLHRHTCLS